MTLLTFEGFDQWATSELQQNPPLAGLPSGWQIQAGIAYTLVAGQLGGRAVPLNATTTLVQYSDPSSHVTIVAGARIQAGNVSTNNKLYGFFDSAGGLQCGLGLNANSQLIFWRGSTANILGTGTQIFQNTAYYYIEVKITVNSSTGSFEVRVNGATEMSGTNVNTQQTGNANIQTFQFGPNTNATGNSWNIDDFYLDDANFNCDPLNALRVETLRPSSNNSVAFTPLTSTNVSQVQESQSDGDSTYNFASAPNTDTFNHGSLVQTPVSLLGVAVSMEVRKDDVSAMTARTKLISGGGGTTSNGVTNNLVPSYQYFKDLYINDPSTGVAWANATAVNGTQIGYERVA